MSREVVFALYRPHEGRDEELRELVKGHLPVLREYGLVTDRPTMLLRSENGTLIEVFEWVSADAARQAHQHPAVARVWERMAGVADFVGLDSLPEAAGRFPHFTGIEP